MLRDIIELALSYIQYLMLIVAIAPSSYQAFYRSPSDILKYINLDLGSLVDEGSRGDNMLDVEIPDEIPLDSRLWFLGISVALPLILNVVSVFILSGKKFFLWFLFIACGVLSFTIGIFYLSLQDEWLTDRVPRFGAILMVILGAVGIFSALGVLAGIMWYMRRQEEIKRRKQGQKSSLESSAPKSKESADREASMSSPITKQQLLAAEEAKAGIGFRNRNTARRQSQLTEGGNVGSDKIKPPNANGEEAATRQQRSAVSLPPPGENMGHSSEQHNTNQTGAPQQGATSEMGAKAKSPRTHPSLAAAVTQGRGNHAMVRESSIFADETIERVFSEGLIHQQLLKQQNKANHVPAHGPEAETAAEKGSPESPSAAEAQTHLTADTNNSHLSKAAVKASYDLIMNRQVEAVDLWATITRGCYFVIFAFLGLYLTRLINVDNSIQNTSDLAQEVLFGLGIVAFVFAAIALLWFVLGFIRTGRVWQFRAEGLLRDHFVSALLLVISVLYIPAVTNVIIIMNCQSIECPAGTRLRDSRSLLIYPSDSPYSVCEPCLVASIPQTCPANVSSSLCLATSGNRLRGDAGVKCSDLQPYFWPAAGIVFFSFVVSVPLLHYLLTRVSTQHLDAEFPLDARQVEGFSEEEIYREKVHLSDNVAKFIYDPFLKRYKQWRLLFIFQKLTTVVVSVFTFSISFMSSESFGLTLSLIIHGVCFFISLAARPFNRKVENIFIIVTQFFLCVTCVIGLLVTLGYEVPEAAGATAAVLTYTIPIMALGLGAMLTFRDEMELELYRDDASRRARHNIKEIEMDGGGTNTEGRPMDLAEEVRRGIATGSDYLLDGDTVYSNDKAIELLANKDRIFLIERLSIEPKPTLSGSYSPWARYQAIMTSNPLLAAGNAAKASQGNANPANPPTSPSNPPIEGWQAISTGRGASPAPKPNTPVQANSGRAMPPNPPPLRQLNNKSPTQMNKQGTGQDGANGKSNFTSPKGTNFNVLGPAAASGSSPGANKHLLSPNQQSAPLLSSLGAPPQHGDNQRVFVPPTLLPPSVNIASGGVTNAPNNDLSVSTSLSTSQRTNAVVRTNVTPPTGLAAAKTKVVSPVSNTQFQSTRARANWLRLKKCVYGHLKRTKANTSEEFLLDGAAGVGGVMTGGLLSKHAPKPPLVKLLDLDEQQRVVSRSAINPNIPHGLTGIQSATSNTGPGASSSDHCAAVVSASLSHGDHGSPVTGEAMQTWDQLLVQLLKAGKRRRQQQLAALREQQQRRRLSQGSGVGSGFFGRKNSNKGIENANVAKSGSYQKLPRKRNRSIASQYADDEEEAFGDDFDNPTNAERRRQQMQLRIHLKAIYERHLYKLISQQRGVDFQINRSTISTLIVFLVFCGVCSFVACTASVLGVLENEEGANYVGATRQSTDLSAQYQLLNFSNWTSFTSHCCCLPYTGLTPTWPYRIVEGEKWVCDLAEAQSSTSSGHGSHSKSSYVIKERFRVTYTASTYQSGLLARPLCGLSFINGCQLVVDNVTRQVSLAGCNSNVTAEARALF